MESNNNDNIIQFIINNNFAGIGLQSDNINYKTGASVVEVIENYNINELSDIQKARFLYLKNLLLIEPTKFHIPLEINPIERILMHCSYKDFISVDKIFECEFGLNIEFQIIGATAKSKAGAEKLINVIYLVNFDRESLKYEDDEHGEVDFVTFKYTEIEMLYLYVYALKILENEDNDILRISGIEAICKMGFFQNNSNFSLFFEYLYTSITKSHHKLENFIKSLLENYMNETYFNKPLIPLFNLAYSLASYKVKCFLFSEAYDLLKNYNFRPEKIKCLLKMNKFNDALIEIDESIKIIGNPTTAYDKIKLSNLYIKIGHIKQDPLFYNKAFAIYNHYPPLKAKACFYYSRKDYENAVLTLKEALKVVPGNNEAKFYLGCSLIELKNYTEALEIFKVLSLEDRRNPDFSKNLSLCYYMKNDVENTLNSLKTIVLEDLESMKLYIKLSVQNKKIPEIKWALNNCRVDAEIQGIIRFINNKSILDFNELRNCLLSNPQVEDKDVGGIIGIL